MEAAQRATTAWTVQRFALGAFVLVLAAPTVMQLVAAWQRHPDYAFAWLLAPVVVWLFFRAAPWRYAGPPSLRSGLLTCLAGGLIYLVARVITWPLLDYAGWLLLARGLVLALWGRTGLGRATPILLFAFFLFPLPLAWLNALALLLQDVISQVAAEVLGLVWVCHRQGNLLYLAGLETPLSVAAECSGVRQLLVFAALGSFLALFVPASWRRLVLIAAAIPVAVLANLLRVLALAVLARYAGPDAIGGLVHDAPLVLTLPLGALCLGWLYGCLRHESNDEVPPEVHHRDLPCIGPLVLLFGGLTVLQLALLFHLHATPATSMPAEIDLQRLAVTLGGWHGQPHPEASQVAAQAEFADQTLTRVYADAHGHAVAVYLVFSRTGLDREHHPEICLRDAGGARELPSGRRTVPMQHGNAERFAYQRGSSRRTTVYYWHYTMLPLRQELSLLQSLYLRQQERMPSVSVQVQVNLTEPALWRAIETTCLPELDHALRQMLPLTARQGSERLPIRFTVE